MENNNPYSDIVLLNNDVLDSLPDLSIVAFATNEYGLGNLWGDNGILYRIGFLSRKRLYRLVPLDRWIDWRTGSIFQEEWEKKGKGSSFLFSPWFSFEGWVCLYYGLGHWMLVREDYWPAIEKEISVTSYREVLTSFPILMGKIFQQKAPKKL